MSYSFHSNVLNENFNTLEELEAAELKAKKEDAYCKAKAHRNAKVATNNKETLKEDKPANTEAEDKQKKCEISKQKKQMSDEIEKLEEEVCNKSAELERAKAYARQIIADAVKEADRKIEDAQNAYKEAEIKRINKVMDFNRNFGIYEVRYSGDRALKELERCTRPLSSFLFTPWFKF